MSNVYLGSVSANKTYRILISDIAEIIRNIHQTIENASHIKCPLALINMSVKPEIEIYH